MKAKIVYLLRKPPYGSANAGEAIDAMLVGAAFDQTVVPVFTDDAVWSLVKAQDAKRFGRRTLGKQVTALSDYDVQTPLVSRRALDVAGIDAADLVCPVRVVDEHEIAAAFAEADAVLSD